MKTGITIYNNAAVARMKNRRIVLQPCSDGENWGITFYNADKQGDKVKATEPLMLRDKVLVTTIKISNEALEHLVESYLNFKAKDTTTTYVWEQPDSLT